MSAEENSALQEERFSHEEDVSAEALRNPIQRERIDKAVAMIGGPNLRVLDVGCGAGEIAELIHDNGNDVTGMDFPAVLARIPETRRLGWMHTIPGDASREPWGFGWSVGDASFDCLFLGETLEHFFDLEPFFSEARRVLKPGGRLVITTPNATRTLNRIAMFFGSVSTWHEWARIPHHMRYFCKRDLDACLRKHGFVPTRWDWGRSQAEGSSDLGFDESWLRDAVSPAERMVIRRLLARLTEDPVERHSFIICEAKVVK